LSMLGYLPEERGMYPKIKVCDQVIYLARLRGMSRTDADNRLKKWLDKFQVAEYYDKRIEELSKGNQQKIQFIAAVIHNPSILVLDEAFSGLDPVNVELLKATVKELRENGTSIVFSTHRMEHVEELCRNITIMDRANPVLQGPIRDIKKKFPLERVVIAADEPIDGLETIPGVTQVDRLELGYQLKVRSPEIAQDVLHHALAQGPVTRFELMEPALHDIFIKTVGERHE
jgi:ABC-2 type transport system ATP-binding protein